MSDFNELERDLLLQQIHHLIKAGQGVLDAFLQSKTDEEKENAIEDLTHQHKALLQEWTYEFERLAKENEDE